MRILIANDDGYLAPGIAALVQACQGLGEIEVLAGLSAGDKVVTDPVKAGIQLKSAN